MQLKKSARNVKMFALACILSISSAFAQEKNSDESAYERSPLFPEQGQFGVSILLDGLIDNVGLSTNENGYGQNLLFAKYYLKEDQVIRMGFGLKLDNYKREQADSSGLTLVEVDSTSKRTLLNLSVGIEKHLTPTKRLDPFLFAQADFTFIGKTTLESEERTISSAGTRRVERTIKRDGGIAFGLQLGGGFNYFLGSRFSIGTELAMRLLVVSEGGTISDNEVTTLPNSPISSTVFSKREDKTIDTNLEVLPNAMINISYFF
jgi:hypothetical protein